MTGATAGSAAGPDPGRPVRVLVVDDDPLVRSALVMVLGGAPDLLVVGEAADGDEVPAATAAHRPDVVLMDVRMPRTDGLRATEALVAARGAAGPDAAGPSVLVLTTFDTDDLVLRALRAGAAGFLLKDTPPAQIVEAVRAVGRGEASFSPTALRHLVDAVARPGPGAAGGDGPRRARALLARLTEREREVMRLIARGYAYKEVAKELFISIKTVETHMSNVLRKLQLSSRHELTRWASDRRLL